MIAGAHLCVGRDYRPVRICAWVSSPPPPAAGMLANPPPPVMAAPSSPPPPDTVRALLGRAFAGAGAADFGEARTGVPEKTPSRGLCGTLTDGTPPPIFGSALGLVGTLGVGTLGGAFGRFTDNAEGGGVMVILGGLGSTRSAALTGTANDTSAKHSVPILGQLSMRFWWPSISLRRLSRAWPSCQAEYWVERAIPYSRKAEVGIAPPGLGVEYLCPFMPKIGKLSDEPPLPSAEMGWPNCRSLATSLDGEVRRSAHPPPGSMSSQRQASPQRAGEITTCSEGSPGQPPRQHQRRDLGCRAELPLRATLKDHSQN